MSERDLTALQREYAAVIGADLAVRLGDGPVTAGDLKRALIESAASLERPIDEPVIIVERNPFDAMRIDVFIPLDLLDELARKADQ